MKIAYAIVLAALCPVLLRAQDAATPLSTGPMRGIYGTRLADDAGLSPFAPRAAQSKTDGDEVKFNMYGNLRDDDPEYNQRSSLWLCAARVVMNNVLTWASDRVIFNADFSYIGPRTWSHNIKTGWEWDTDRFGMNYFFHPYGGAGYFNAARANGYNFFESAPFAFGGSLMWEYFGENTLPSINDLINTTVTGIFLGEITYRLSSNFLDDRTTGSERVFREILAGIINPGRAFGRLLQGKLFRVTPVEVYQKEPLNMTFAVGAHLVNDGRIIGTGSANEMLSLQLDYGNPFEQRSRKVFDYFTLRGDITIGAGRKIVDNVFGQGILFGSNVHSGNLDMLIGGFQHYDFWDNKTFELGTIAFGGGVVSKLALGTKSNLYTALNLAIVPLAGNSTQLGPDTSQFRDYNYGGGAEGKFESTLNLASWMNFTLRGYYYWIHTYVGVKGESFIGIVKPSVAFSIFGQFSVGLEHMMYFTDRYPRDYPNVHGVRTEQRIFVQYFVDNFKHER